MQARQLQQGISRIEQSIDDAALACHASAMPPEALRSCISELDRRSGEMEAAVEQGADEEGIRAKVEALEALGNRALRACREGGVIDPQLRDAVQQVYDEISALMQQLH
jgi:hypothetical protein